MKLKENTWYDGICIGYVQKFHKSLWYLETYSSPTYYDWQHNKDDAIEALKFIYLSKVVKISIFKRIMLYIKKRVKVVRW